MLFVRFRSALERFRVVLKPAIAFEFWSTLIFMVSFAPASGWLLNRLVAGSGQYAVSDNDLLAFFLSSAGLLFLILGVGLALAFWFAEQVGLLIISVKAAYEKKVSVSLVLWEQITHLPALIRLGLLQAAGYLAASIPFILGIGLTYWLLLREWDLYYYINVQPSSWWIAVIIAGAISAAYLLLAAWLYIRWLFAIPALVFEDATPLGALRKSWQQTRGRFRELAVPVALWWVVVIISSLAMTWLVRAAAARLLDHIGLSLKFVVPVVVGTLVLITILDIIWFIIGKIAHVLLMTDFYLEATDAEHKLSSSAPAAGILSPAALKRIGWLIAGIVLIMGVATGAAFIQGFNINRTIEITGHRGIRQKGFSSDCVVSSLNFQALTESKQAFPELTTGFIVFKVAGNLSRMEADFMSINAAGAAPGLVRRLHRHGRAVHVWTVNDFTNVISMIEVGVDNIITDHPRDVRRYLEDWNALSDTEKIVLMLRNLIVGLERPQPSAL